MIITEKKKKAAYTPPTFIGQNIYLKPSYIVSVPEFDYAGGRIASLDFLANQANLRENNHRGKLSRKAITGLRNSINWLCLAAKRKRVYVRSLKREFHFRVNFITLTLPDTDAPITSEDLQKKLLNPWLTSMRKSYGLRNYIWRLEFQANGKLHVHLTCDTFLHHAVIRNAWNNLLERNGYLEKFRADQGHTDPNSTDVHATRKVKNMAAYLAKYMSKKGSGYSWRPADISRSAKESEDAGHHAEARKLRAQIDRLKPVRPLGAMQWKRWYVQRVNFWNSPYNPRPITGRIWGCSTQLSRANKITVHIPANECAEALRCLMNSSIEYRDLTVKPKETENSRYLPADHIYRQPRKIGEVYFLKAADWFSKISGPIRRAFEDARSSIESLCSAHTFELV